MADKNKVQVYNIGVCNSDADGVDTYRVEGTFDDVVKLVNDMVLSYIHDACDTEESGYSGIESLEIDEENLTVAARPFFNDFHIDVDAVPETPPIKLPMDKELFTYLIGTHPDNIEKSEDDPDL